MRPSYRPFPAACFALGVALAAAAAACSAVPGDGQALWRIVDGGCRSGAAAGRPGLTCETAQGYAVLKDRCGATHYLLLPLARRTGIESPELQRADEPRYLALAWEQRGRSLAAAAGDTASRADLGLAVNSRYGRSQSQLHVHIDFVRPEVRAALAALPRPVPAGARVRLAGHEYRVDALDSLGGNLFEQVAQEWGARTEEERASLTLAVVGDGARGYFLLSDRADLLAFDRGHAEELLIERMCR